MRAIHIERFGGPEVIRYVEVERPTPMDGQALIRVKAAGVGPWDGLIRRGQSTLVGSDSLPVILGSDISGVVETVGQSVSGFVPGDEVFGVTNGQFIGGYADYAVADARMIAKRPRAVGFAEAASAPVVAVTAWQMLFDHAAMTPGQSVLVLGASGNVGGFAVQLAKSRGIHVTAAGRLDDAGRLRTLGADQVVDSRGDAAEFARVRADAVIDAAGGELQRNSLSSLRQGGVLVSAVSPPDAALARERGVRSVYFIVDVTSACLTHIATLIDAGALETRLGAVLPLNDARTAHEMLEGVRPAAPGKTVLVTS